MSVAMVHGISTLIREPLCFIYAIVTGTEAY